MRRTRHDPKNPPPSKPRGTPDANGLILPEPPRMCGHSYMHETGPRKRPLEEATVPAEKNADTKERVELGTLLGLKPKD